MDKILITGTGRCGTTFLIKLFTFLNFDTGFTKENYYSSISKNCNSGMEKKYNENYYILKNPTFMRNIEYIAKDTSIKIKYVIIPVRDLVASAKSRVKHGHQDGGLWNAKDEFTQIKFYKDIIANYISVSTKYEINTIFIDFDKMVTEPSYLFNKIRHILDEENISFETFLSTYNDVSATSKP